MPEQREPLLRVDGLWIETADGTEIVKDVSFDLYRQETLALVGESGCGKTTTALALLGHARSGTRIAGGSVSLEGCDVLQLQGQALEHVRGRLVSYVPQNPGSALNPRHRVGAQIAEVILVHGARSLDAQRAVDVLVAQVGLPAGREFLGRYPFELSGGQQQRVAIAMALACKPRVIVLDEPTTGLDVTTQARVLELLRELGRETGTAFVYVTHDLAVVDNLADRVAVLYAGRVVETGPRQQVFRSPAHPYTAMLLGSTPRMSVRSRLVGIVGSAPPPGARPDGCSFEPRCPIAIDLCGREFPPEVAVAGAHRCRCWRASDFAVPTSELLIIDTAEDFLTGTSFGAADDSLLVIDGLVASYGRDKQRSQVVNGASFSVAPGGCLALVGESGSGKTTIGRCVAGLHRPDSGSVVFEGTRLAPWVGDRSRDERRAIQMIFQSPDRSLNPREPIVTALSRPLRLFGYADRRSQRSQAAELLDRVRLPTRYLDRYPLELSGGERQRVAIARALAARPSLLICDEITSALDVSTQAAIVSLLAKLRSEGLVLLFITHNLALVNSIADDIVVLEAGEVREEGRTSDIMRRPSAAYTRELISAAPELQGQRL